MTASDRTGFLAAILEDPADDTARGAYADALRESDDAYDQLHGRFLWAGLTLARFRGSDPVDDGMFFDAIRDQAEAAPVVLAEQVKAMLAWPWDGCAWDNMAPAPDRCTVRKISELVAGETRGERAQRRRRPEPVPSVTWERGCVHTLRVTLAVWQNCAARVLTNCPLERVQLVEIPGLLLRIERRDNGGWAMVGSLDLPRVIDHTTGAVTAATLLTRTCPRIEPTPAHDRDMLIRNVWDWTDVLLTLLRDASGARWPGPADWPEPTAPDVEPWNQDPA